MTLLLAGFVRSADARRPVSKDKQDMTELDPRRFRNALAAFATGVTIVTTRGGEGEPIGVTASSFNSVSLDPPLVLWSLGKSSKSFPAFCESGHFAVHVLACNQQALSNAFAKSGADKFAGVDWTSGKLGSPVLGDFAAKFECRTVHQYDGGDHVIFVGEVVQFEQKDIAPLVFHGGQYAETRPKLGEDYRSGVEPGEARFTDDFLLYLVSLAHFQTNATARRKLLELNLSQPDFYALTALSLSSGLTETEITKRLEHTGQSPSLNDLESLVQRGLAGKNGSAYLANAAGRDLIMEMLSVSKATEETLLAHFTPTEIAEFKHLLKKLISVTGEPSPNLWDEPSV